MSNLKNKIYSSMVYLAKIYGSEKVDSERIKMYTEVLSEELTSEETQRAIRQVVAKCKFFPSIAEIIELARPKVDTHDEATIIANEIIECISRFGPYQIQEVRQFLGDKFFIAERFGWANLCAIQNNEIFATKAQLRDLAKAYINQSKRENGGLFVDFNFKVKTESIDARKAKGLKLLDFAEINGS
jgi:hypothetical protein